MSIAQNPLLGPMKNSMGNFTVYSYHGMNIVRSKAFTIKDPKSDKQLAVRTRITVLASTYRALSRTIRLGFPECSEDKSPQNMFVSVNFRTAFSTTPDGEVISYPRMLISQGSLPGVKVLEATLGVDGLAVRYETDLTTDELSPNDELVACALLTTGELLITRQTRGYEPVGTILLEYPDLHSPDITCCYVFARSWDGKKASDSVFVKVKE
jgi:hypothetical protein